MVLLLMCTGPAAARTELMLMRAVRRAPWGVQGLRGSQGHAAELLAHTYGKPCMTQGCATNPGQLHARRL